MGKPDLIVELPVNFPVPAEGTIDCTWMASDMKLTEDKREVEGPAKYPGGRRSMRWFLHVLWSPVPDGPATREFPGAPEVRKPRTRPQTDSATFAISNGFPGGVEMIGDYVVNGDPFIAGPGQARLVRAGSHMLFPMYYTSNGRAGTDRTRVGIIFAKTPQKERVVNDTVLNSTLRVPPGSPDHQVTGTVTFLHDTFSAASARICMCGAKRCAMNYSEGDATSAETLLYVPAYNFNWQLNISLRHARWKLRWRGRRVNATPSGVGYEHLRRRHLPVNAVLRALTASLHLAALVGRSARVRQVGTHAVSRLGVNPP